MPHNDPQSFIRLIHRICQIVSTEPHICQTGIIARLSTTIYPIKKSKAYRILKYMVESQLLVYESQKNPRIQYFYCCTPDYDNQLTRLFFPVEFYDRIATHPERIDTHPEPPSPPAETPAINQSAPDPITTRKEISKEPEPSPPGTAK